MDGEIKMGKEQENEKHVHVDLTNSTVKSAENYVKMVAMGDLLGCVLIGPAGMGKTHLVDNVIKDMNIPKNKYVKYGGHITLASIYEFLFENSDKLIFFDDCSQLINQTEIMELLKQSLQTNGSRILNYRSYGTQTQAPKKFAFEGQIIMAFNSVDKGSPNVRAIIDRAPMIELKYSRKEIFDAMYQIAEHEGGGLLDYEKTVVTREIENWTKQDSGMYVSLRGQQLAFRIFKSFKKIFGESNTEWMNEVKKLFGKPKESWIRELVRELVGDGMVTRRELVKQIAIRRNMSPRNAERKINEYVEIEDIFQDKLRNSNVSIKPFK